VHCLVIGPDYTLYVPNAFSPNGDGMNETFYPKGSGIDESRYKMWIFDRWGNMIWYTEQWGKGWDGHANDGNDVAQEDVYIWKIQVYDYLNKKHDYIGHVSMVK
jgi:gliding motility-associated-like protein